MFEMEPVWPFLQILIAADEADVERWAVDDFGTDRDGRDKGVVDGDPMVEHLSPQGYEQTKAKLTNLEARLAEIERRDDLPAGHRREVCRSYHEMMQQYRREIKVYEALAGRLSDKVSAQGAAILQTARKSICPAG